MELHHPGPVASRSSRHGVLTGPAYISAVIGAIRLAKMPIPRPGAPAADIRAYYTSSATAARFSAAGQLISILSPAQFTTAVARLAANRAATHGPCRRPLPLAVPPP